MIKFKIGEWLLLIAAILLLLAGCGGCHYIGYKAFKQKYPNASYWVYLLEKK